MADLTSFLPDSYPALSKNQQTINRIGRMSVERSYFVLLEEEQELRPVNLVRDFSGFHAYYKVGGDDRVRVEFPQRLNHKKEIPVESVSHEGALKVEAESDLAKIWRDQSPSFLGSAMQEENRIGKVSPEPELVTTIPRNLGTGHTK